jgi:hypothetical protein
MFLVKVVKKRSTHFVSSTRLTAFEIINRNCSMCAFPNLYMQQPLLFLFWAGDRLFYNTPSVNTIFCRMLGWLLNEEGFGRKRLWPNRGIIPAFGWRDWEKAIHSSQDGQCPAEIRTNHVPNTSLHHYLCANPFDISSGFPDTRRDYRSLLFSIIINKASPSISALTCICMQMYVLLKCNFTYSINIFLAYLNTYYSAYRNVGICFK